MSTLFVDSSILSSVARFFASRINNVTIIEVTDAVKGSEQFKKASPKGEIPVLCDDKGAFVGIVNLSNALAPQDSLVLALDADEKETEKWIKFISSELAPLLASKDNKLTGKLHKINKDLLTVTFFLGGTSPSVVDLAFYYALHPLMQAWNDAERVSFCNITRWFDYLQHHETVHNVAKLPIIKIKKDISVVEKPKQEKPTEEKAKEKQDQGSKQEKGKKAEKKEDKQETKETKVQAEPKEESADVSKLDIRVGKILTVKAHEDADTLYVETINVGEAKPRTVVSGLRKFVSLEEMQNRLVVVLCNLKPSKLKGVLSEAMVLAASNADHTKVELLDPPAGSVPGDRISFEGYKGQPEEQLNPKKKVWETVQPEFSTTDDCVAVYKGVPFTTPSGHVKVSSITKGQIK